MQSATPYVTLALLLMAAFSGQSAPLLSAQIELHRAALSSACPRGLPAQGSTLRCERVVPLLELCAAPHAGSGPLVLEAASPPRDPAQQAGWASRPSQPFTRLSAYAARALPPRAP